MVQMKLIVFSIAALLVWDGVKITHTDDEWRSILGFDCYCVMRRKATEKAYSGRYLFCNQEGTYHCAACGLPLFHSSSKYDAHTAWPSFREPVIQKHVWIKEDYSLIFRRYEVLCRSCDGHLGHVFRDTPESLRYTINSIALEFRENVP
jgi:peptide-methionine (R)-S-oxide reductase